MSISNDGLWIMIRRRDIFDYDSISCNSIIHQDVLPPDSTFEQIKSMVYSWAKIEDNNTKVIKLRKYDNTLIPYSALLQGSTRDKPIIVEVTDVHQFTPLEKRTIPEGYTEALQSKVKELEKRVESLEAAIPEFTASHIQEIEDEATNLVNQLEFLSRRIDQLSPASWPT